VVFLSANESNGWQKGSEEGALDWLYRKVPVERYADKNIGGKSKEVKNVVKDGEPHFQGSQMD
jgi:hypothetical protein